MAGRIQGADLKTEAELVTAGADKTYLPKDSQIYVEALSINKTLDDAIADGDIGGGSGGGGFNFLSTPNSTFSSSVGDWIAYDDGASAVPVDGTGGSPGVISLSRVTSFDSKGGLRISHSAADGQGEGASVAFSVDPKYRGSACTIKGRYLSSSGYADDDLHCWIIDVTNSNALIQPAPYKLKASLASGEFKFEFQTSATGASYKLVFHCPNTTATSYTVDVDDISVGPTQYNYGLVGTDWKSYTPTITGFGTPTSVEFEWRRIGDAVEIQGKFASGTPSSTEARISLPNSIVSADTSRIPSIMFAGYGVGNFNGASQYTFLIEPSVGYLTMSQQGSGNTGLTKLNGDAILGSGNALSFKATVPISGWSSNVQLSEDADLRLQVARYTDATGPSFSAGSAAIFKPPTKDFDTHGFYDTSTGNYTVYSSGKYRVSANILFNGTSDGAVYLFARKNTTTIAEIGQIRPTSNVLYGIGGSAIIDCVVGDTIKAWVDNSSSSTITLDAVGPENWVTFEKLQGPSAVAASEEISAKYAATSLTNSIPNTSAPTVFDAPIKVWDTHNMVTTGSGWQAVLPISGKWRMTACVLTGGEAWTGGDYLIADVAVNGTSVSQIHWNQIAASASIQMNVHGSTVFKGLAGDAVNLVLLSSRTGGSVTTIEAAAERNYIILERVGNY